MQWRNAERSGDKPGEETPSAVEAPAVARVPDIPLASPANANDRRETRLAARLFLDDWRAAQTDPVELIDELPVGGLTLDDNSCVRIECADALDAANFDHAIAELSRVLHQEGIAVIAARLGHTPLSRLNRKRRLVGSDPVRFEAAEALTCAHLDRLRAHFGGVEVHTFDLFAFALSAAEAGLGRVHPKLRRVCAPLWPLCRKIDSILLGRPSLRRYGCTAVAVLRWPRRHERD